MVGIEHIQELVDWSLDNLRKDGLGPALDSGEIIVIAGDGRQGFPENGMQDICFPFDKPHHGILVKLLTMPSMWELQHPLSQQRSLNSSLDPAECSYLLET